jgi:hypothetical protein
MILNRHDAKDAKKDFFERQKLSFLASWRSSLFDMEII